MVYQTGWKIGYLKLMNSSMAENTYSSLKKSGYAPGQELSVRKILATSELGKRYHLNISGDKRSSLFQVDGYIISDGKRCD